MKKYFGESNEICNVNSLVVINASKKHDICVLLPESIKKESTGEVDEVQTLAEILKVGYSLVTNDNKLVNYFKAFNDYGIYCPKSARESYISCIRRNDNQAIMLCTNISGKTYDEDGRAGYWYTFEEVFVSSVALKETALSMSKKTLEALAKLKHNKGWRNAALGLMSQFDVVSLKARIKAGEDLKASLEDESEDNTKDVLSENAA